MNPRHHQIIQLVNSRGSVTVSELAQLTGVSEVTVRQDLTLLERDRLLRRVHGSALALDSDNVGTRLNTRYPIKQALALHAARLVEPGSQYLLKAAAPTPCWRARWPTVPI